MGQGCETCCTNKSSDTELINGGLAAAGANGQHLATVSPGKTISGIGRMPSGKKS